MPCCAAPARGSADSISRSGCRANWCATWAGRANWRKLVEFCGDLTRAELRGILDGYRATRPAGRKYAHRRTDLPAGSSSPMKLVNPPVALMFHEGAPRLADAGVHLPGLADGDRSARRAGGLSGIVREEDHRQRLLQK